MATVISTIDIKIGSIICGNLNNLIWNSEEQRLIYWGLCLASMMCNTNLNIQKYLMKMFLELLFMDTLATIQLFINYFIIFILISWFNGNTIAKNVYLKLPKETIT